MTRDDALQFIPLIEAWARGEVIQGRIRAGCDDWFDYTIDNLVFDDKVSNYRIKPKKVKRYARMYLTPDGVAVAEDIDPRIIQSIRNMGSKEPYPWISEWVPYEVEVEQ